MEQSRFSIIFEKLVEVGDAEDDARDAIAVSEGMRADVDEIGELRRLVLETTELDQKSYTTT